MMKGSATTIALAVLAFCAMAGSPAARGEEPLASPLAQARETDQVLRRLSASPALSRAATTSVTAASSATTATTASHALLLKGRLRPTTATLILRRARTPLGASGATTSALAAAVPAVPDLARMLTAQVTPLTTATRAEEIPRLDPVWLSPGRRPAVPAAAAAIPATGKVRVNEAEAPELRARLNLDAARARNIIQFRTVHGPFKEPEDLAQVEGITDAMVKQWDDADMLIF